MTKSVSLTIKNFKSYKEATLPLASLTLLIGANASGKSNAIEAFRFLSWVAGGERLSTLKNRVNDSDKVVRGSVKDLAYNSTDNFALSFIANDDLEYEGVFQSTSNNVELINEVIRSKHEKIYILKTFEPPYFSKLSKFYLEELSKEFDKKRDRNELKNFLTGRYLNNITVYKSSDKDISEFLLVDKHIAILEHIDGNATNAWFDFATLRDCLQQSFFFDFIPSTMRTDSISDASLRVDGSNLAGVLHRLSQDKDTKAKLLKLVQSLPEQDITDINFYEDHRGRIEFSLIETFGNEPIEQTMDLLSDGTLKVLGIAAALLSVPEGSTVVIEEIDNSIHPSRAHVILELIQQYASERKLKLLLSTHNSTLMDALPDEALADVVFCYRDPKRGDSKLIRLGDLDDYLGLVAQGTLGDLVTQGIVERFVKHPITPTQRKQQALAWLDQLQQEVE